MTNNQEQFSAVRAQFPALSRVVAGQPAVFFDGPAGTQVPQSVIDAVSGYLANTNANHEGLFATSIESDELIDSAHRAVAALIGTDDAHCVAFGPNMTTLTFALSRALAKTWSAGDEIVLTRLEHDANFTPWALAAVDTGATIRMVDIHPEDCTLDLDDFRSKINEKTKLVAVGCASNAVGTVNPVKQICTWARDAGALSFLDAVHYAPHALIDVEDWGCDFLACSAYKFFGPHVGIMWGRQELLESINSYKVRPATNDLPGKWMTGTQNHEGIVGTLAAVDYLAELGRGRESLSPPSSGASSTSGTEKKTPDPIRSARRENLRTAFDAIGKYERELIARLISGLQEIDGVKVWGITDAARLDERLPTVSITHRTMHPADIARRLGERGIFVWHGNYYALPLTEALGVEPDGMVRIGPVHYNTADEVDRFLHELRALMQEA